jgi:ABC-2 type transport system permease protein
VRAGDVPVAIIVPRGFGETFGAFDRERPVVQLLADTGDPVAPQMVGGLLQKAAMTATPDVVAGRGIAQFERYAGKLTPQQRKAVDEWLPLLRRRSSGLAAADSAAGGAGDSAVSGAGSPQVAGPGGMLETKVVDVLGEQKKNPVIAFYAAGIAVMFLLFSASGAGGSLLDEVESGTLERLLSSNARMGRLLLGKGLFIMLLGVLQVTVMFVWGALGFNLDLLGHLPGFAVMTIATAAAASGLGLLLATACRTRAQLGGIATLVILSMSALGGSMVPRFLMSEGMQRVGLVTFNAWALDGYVKVFWREAPIVALWPQVAVLLGMALGFFGLARLLARRWESV